MPSGVFLTNTLHNLGDDSTAISVVKLGTHAITFLITLVGLKSKALARSLIIHTEPPLQYYYSVQLHPWILNQKSLIIL